MTNKVEQLLEDITIEQSNDPIVNGCAVLEGGAFRGLSTQGVLDVFMANGINLQTTIGVSAGALSGMNYVSRQIGRSITINLSYRQDPHYIGRKALSSDKGITGFSYLFNEISEEFPLDEEAFNDPRRRFVAVATNVETGKAEYFERGKCSDIYKAIAASATVPYVSLPVEIDGNYYLDGGIADKIPYEWALQEGFEKIIVIRTRDENYRKGVRPLISLIQREYRKYPMIRKSLLEDAPLYNIQIQRLEQLEKMGKLFVISPSKPITISRFESDLDKLREVYDLGVQDAKNILPQVKEYLGMQ